MGYVFPKRSSQERKSVEVISVYTLTKDSISSKISGKSDPYPYTNAIMFALSHCTGSSRFRANPLIPDSLESWKKLKYMLSYPPLYKPLKVSSRICRVLCTHMSVHVYPHTEIGYERILSWTYFPPCTTSSRTGYAVSLGKLLCHYKSSEYCRQNGQAVGLSVPSSWRVKRWKFTN